jgi:hypothetical protein
VFVPQQGIWPHAVNILSGQKVAGLLQQFSQESNPIPSKLSQKVPSPMQSRARSPSPTSAASAAKALVLISISFVVTAASASTASMDMASTPRSPRPPISAAFALGAEASRRATPALAMRTFILEKEYIWIVDLSLLF